MSDIDILRRELMELNKRLLTNKNLLNKIQTKLHDNKRIITEYKEYIKK